MPESFPTQSSPELENTVEKKKERPTVFRNVTFVPVYNRKKEITGYKSSEFGRKQIVADEKFAPEPDKTYRVRVVEDTNPNDPLSGKYVTEIVTEDSSALHTEAMLEKSRRLRESFGFRSLAEMINNDPDLSYEHRLVTERAPEFKMDLQKDEEKHRMLTPLLSAILLSEDAKDLFDVVIDREVAEDSSFIGEQIDRGNDYVPEVVVGSGVHSAIWNIVRHMILPNDPGLTTEQSTHVGGQFAQYDRPLFRKNDRQRKELRDKPHEPGTEQSLTTFTEYAAVQPSDFGGESYPYQDSTATAARVNMFLTSRCLAHTDIQAVLLNPEFGINTPDTPRYIVEAYDTTLKKVREIKTDRVVFPTGVGKEATRLNERDQQTKQILREEKEKINKGKEAVVYGSVDFNIRLGDETKPFPLRGIKKVILSGEGDSTYVIAGLLLGYESQIGKTTTQLDSIEEIIWLGQSIPSKEEVMACIRARYHWVGLDFPREKFEEYYHRIKPVPDVRSSRLERIENGIRVIAVSDETDFETKYEGDVFVHAHGFEDDTNKILAPLSNVIFKGEEITPSIFEAATIRPGSQIYYKNITNVKRLSVVDRNSFRIVYTGGLVSLSNNINLPAELKDVRNIVRIEVNNSNDKTKTLGTLLYEDAEQRKPIARVIAPGVFKVGPVSKIPITEDEKINVAVYAEIPENSAAIFRYAPFTESLARMCALEDKKYPKRLEKSLLKAKKRKSKRDVSAPESSTLGKFVVYNNIRIGESRETLPYKIDTLNRFRLISGELLRDTILPKSVKNISFSIEQIGLGSLVFEVIALEKLSPEIVNVFYDFFNDEDISIFLDKLTSVRGTGKSKVKINFPTNEGKLDHSNITYTIQR